MWQSYFLVERVVVFYLDFLMVEQCCCLGLDESTNERVKGYLHVSKLHVSLTTECDWYQVRKLFLALVLCPHLNSQPPEPCGKSFAQRPLILDMVTGKRTPYALMQLSQG